MPPGAKARLSSAVVLNATSNPGAKTLGLNYILECTSIRSLSKLEAWVKSRAGT